MEVKEPERRVGLKDLGNWALWEVRGRTFLQVVRASNPRMIGCASTQNTEKKAAP